MRLYKILIKGEDTGLRVSKPSVGHSHLVKAGVIEHAHELNQVTLEAYEEKSILY